MGISRRSFLAGTGLAAAGALAVGRGSKAAAQVPAAPAQTPTTPAAPASTEPARCQTYLADVCAALKVKWPGNRMINIVCHGHSVPAGYFKTPVVDTFNAYPHLLHVGIKERFPFAVLNVIVTAIGGENSVAGAARFERDVLSHRPSVVTIDYSLNDRGPGLEKAEAAWSAMIEQALAAKVKVILMTPTSDLTQLPTAPEAQRLPLKQQAEQVRRLAAKYGLALADSLAAFEAAVAAGKDLKDLLSQSNHPNRAGHDLAAAELLKWFPG
jgi:lysophospholipase L1-like esterase